MDYGWNGPRKRRRTPTDHEGVPIFVFALIEVMDKDVKTAVTMAIMHALPLWFSPPEDIDHKSITHRDFPFFAVYDDEKVIGFAALKIHNQFTADIYSLGVLEAYHRKGVGHMLVDQCLRYCKINGFVYLTVKTLDASVDYKPYEQTRAFYRKEGFVPLEVFTRFWNRENPCLFLIKNVDSR